VHAQLSSLRAIIDQVVIGQIPDGIITDAKLSNASGQIKERITKLIYLPNDSFAPSNVISDYPEGYSMFRASGDWLTQLGFVSSVIVTTYRAIGSSYYARQVVTGYENYNMLFRVGKSLDVWGDWQQIVTTNKPPWITATLQNGATGTLEYRLNQIGQLELRAAVSFSTVAWGTVIATLPAGYRPVRHASIPIYNATNAATGLELILSSTGEIRIRTDGIITDREYDFSIAIPI